jgi:hypothetical protein
MSGFLTEKVFDYDKKMSENPFRILIPRRRIKLFM